MKCAKHPKYQAKRAPRAKCAKCEKMWKSSPTQFDMVADEFEDKYRKDPNFICVGIVETDTLPYLIVYARKKIVVPKTFKGYKVEVKITGKIKPLGS